MCQLFLASCFILLFYIEYHFFDKYHNSVVTTLQIESSDLEESKVLVVHAGGPSRGLWLQNPEHLGALMSDSLFGNYCYP